MRLQPATAHAIRLDSDVHFGALAGVATVLLALALAAPARATCSLGTCSLAGNSRFELSIGLPIPLTAAARPDGRIRATPLATVMQGAVAPRSVIFGGGELTAGAFPVTIGLFPANTLLFQLHTSISAVQPTAPATLSSGGRTGPSTVSWCPGFALPAPGFNPGCGVPALGAPVTGLLRYTKTANQFGGPVPAAFAGVADLALRAGVGAPCAGVGCTFAIGNVPIITTPQIGNAFGTVTATAPSNVPGVFTGSVTVSGLIALVGAPLGPVPSSTITSWGGPWTTGMLTVSLSGVGAIALITTGSDGRDVAGSGVLSLVAGGIVSRSLIGPGANAAWLNLLVPEPSAAVSVGAALATLALCRVATSRSRNRRRET